MTNMGYVHTVTIGRVNTIMPGVLVMGCELVQLSREMICGTGIHIPVCVNTVDTFVSDRIISCTISNMYWTPSPPLVPVAMSNINTCDEGLGTHPSRPNLPDRF